MLSWIRRTFWQMVARFRAEQHAAPPIVPAPQPPLPREPVTGPEPPEPVVSVPAAPTGNRQMRRRISALERARMKHDKFITPQGTPPVPKPKQEHVTTTPHAVVPASDDDDVDDNEALIADRHHTGGSEEVLYKETEIFGEYSFRDTILEQLERYFVYLRRMKLHDPQSYGFYKELGATILPYSAINVRGNAREEKEDKDWSKEKVPPLPTHFKANRPSFGCYVYGANPATEAEELEETEKRKKTTHQWMWIPKFMYFTKYREPPPELQPMSGGDIYKMSIWWDRPHDPNPKHANRKGGPQEYGVFVSRDGNHLQILRTIETKMVQIERKKKKHNAHGNVHFYTTIPQRAWRIPNDYQEWAESRGANVQTFLQKIFVDAVSVYEHSNFSMIRIEARKDDMVAVFSVNVRRMAYFFKDRDYVLTANGGRKSVFHMVRAHDRHTKHGVVHVKFHFRGEHEFTWAGYQISVTVPGRDHFMLPEMDVGFHDEFWREEDDEEEWIDAPELGKKMHEWIKQGLGGSKK